MILLNLVYYIGYFFPDIWADGFKQFFGGVANRKTERYRSDIRCISYPDGTFFYLLHIKVIQILFCKNIIYSCSKKSK